jgi:hypothetical protein
LAKGVSLRLTPSHASHAIPSVQSIQFCNPGASMPYSPPLYDPCGDLVPPLLPRTPPSPPPPTCGAGTRRERPPLRRSGTDRHTMRLEKLPRLHALSASSSPNALPACHALRQLCGERFASAQIQQLQRRQRVNALRKRRERDASGCSQPPQLRQPANACRQRREREAPAPRRTCNAYPFHTQLTRTSAYLRCLSQAQSA